MAWLRVDLKVACLAIDSAGMMVDRLDNHKAEMKDELLAALRVDWKV